MQILSMVAIAHNFYNHPTYQTYFLTMEFCKRANTFQKAASWVVAKLIRISVVGCRAA